MSLLSHSSFVYISKVYL
uniref:Uncharacterized protein n=1 Tax=Anguilla anguilla TaxID=7936 RepID=A0A0E9SP32_ANGAN